MTPADQDIARVLYEALQKHIDAHAVPSSVCSERPAYEAAQDAIALYEASITEPLESDSPVEKLRVAGL